MTSALRAAGSTRRWRRLRALVLDRDGNRCQVPVNGGDPNNGGAVCGAFATHVDHVLPRKLGGSDNPGNLRAACSSCNLRRGAASSTPPPPRVGGSWSW